MDSSSEGWSADANEALQIQIIRPSSTAPEVIHEFHPKWTYPIFGEEQRIFGYKDLAIDLKFAAHDLRPHVSISYERKFPAVGTTVALDILKALKLFLPEEAFVREAEFQQHLQDDSHATNKPPGSLVHTYVRHGRTFEVWAGSLVDPIVRRTVDRMQILVSLFIEAGTPIAIDDPDWSLDRWRVYFVYEKSAPSSPLMSPYSFVGYATSYRYWFFKSLTTPLFDDKTLQGRIAPTTLPSQFRISQFLILPPYQSGGHGSALYQAIYAEAMADPTIIELSVEDPNEEFDKLRDMNDWKVLEPGFKAAGVKIDTSVDNARLRLMPTAKLLPLEALKQLRTRQKIASRQFARQLEMYLLSLIPFSHRAAGGANMSRLLTQKGRLTDPGDKAYYWWRLLLKQRIYKKNKAQLQQEELEDRIPKVDEAARAQEDEYELLLLAYATALARESGVLQNGNGSGSSSKERKRKVVDDDDDEEEELSPAEKRTKA